MAFFESFLSDEDFLASYHGEGGKLFGFYYTAACQTLSPRLWTSLIELALLPQIDFNEDNLTSSFPGDLLFAGPPLLFPTPDLFLGCADFPTSLALLMMLNENDFSRTEAEERGAAAIRSLCGGLDISPMSYLMVSGLNVCADHPTDSHAIWSVVRESVRKALNDLLDKWQGSGEDETPKPAPEIFWSIVCESWRLRLLFYRQLSSPAFNLPEVIDEYRLFEMQLPDTFRLIELPVHQALHNPAAFKEFVIDQADGKTPPEAAKTACLDLAETLYARSLTVSNHTYKHDHLLTHTKISSTHTNISTTHTNIPKVYLF